MNICECGGMDQTLGSSDEPLMGTVNKNGDFFPSSSSTDIIETAVFVQKPMSLYEKLTIETERQMAQRSIYGIDISIAFKLLCDEVDKIQQMLKQGNMDG